MGVKQGKVAGVESPQKKIQPQFALPLDLLKMGAEGLEPPTPSV